MAGNLIHQKQKDTFNCGVFVCAFFEILVNKTFSLFNTNVDLVDHRNKIRNLIKEKSKIKICCICKTASLKRKMQIFKNFKLFECGHKFHIECLNKVNNCVVCYDINF